MRIIMEWHENYTGNNFLIRLYEISTEDGKAVKYQVSVYGNGLLIKERNYVRDSFATAKHRFMRELTQLTEVK